MPALDRAAAYSWRLLLVAAAGALVAAVLIQLRIILIPVVAAAFLATVLAPPVRWLEARRLPPVLATLVVLILSVALLVGAGVVLVPQVADQLDDLGGRVGEAMDRLDTLLVETVGVPGDWLDQVIQGVAEELRRGGLASRALRGARIAVEAAVSVLLTVVVLFFFLKDGPRLAGWGLRQVPERRRPVVAAAARRSWGVMGAYLRGVAITGLVDAVFIGLGLVVLGVPLALPLAVLVFFGALFPLVGAVVTGALAVAVALVSVGLTKALAVTALVIAVQQLESNVVAPVILNRAVRLHPLVIVLALTAGGVLGGVLGAFLAVPLTAVAVALVSELRSHRLSTPEEVPEGLGRVAEPSAERAG